jgi:hypothetical protein
MRQVLTLVVALLCGSVAAAADRRPLPAFSVATAGGVTTASSELVSRPGRWLLIYVTPGCLPCDRLLASLDSWDVVQQHAGRTVVLVADEPESLESRIRLLMPGSAAAVRLYADIDRRAASALGVTGAPVVVGIEDGLIDWTVAGVLNDPKTLETLVRTWLAR